MADCTKEFNQLLAKIDLSKTKIENLKRGRDALREKIKNYYKDNDKTLPEFCGQGSFKMKTTIVQKDEDYDLDDGVYLNSLPEDKNNWPKTEDVHTEIINAVDGHTDTPPKDKTACVRVQYKNDYHIDLAIYGIWQEKIYLARRGDAQWEENDPKLFTDWFYEKKEQHGENFRTIIKIIKKWAYFNGYQEDISGFIITILVGNNYTENSSERIDSILASTLQAIVYDLEQNRKIVRPVKPKINKTEKYTDDEFQRLFTNRFASFKTKANKAVNASSKQDACDIWISLFGEDFPSCDEEPEQSQERSFSITRETRPWGN